MPKEPSPFEKLLVDLSRAEVRFITVGGVACALCGFVRTTEDVDIIVDADPENIRMLLQTLAGFGEGHARELEVSDFTNEEGAIRVIEDFPLDIFVRLRGNTYDDLKAHVAQHHTSGTSIPYLNAQGLIFLKGQSSRDKDRIDVQALGKLLEDDPHA